MAKFVINAMLLPNLIQVTESISGSVVPLAMFLQTVMVEVQLEEVESIRGGPPKI